MWFIILLVIVVIVVIIVKKKNNKPSTSSTSSSSSSSSPSKTKPHWTVRQYVDEYGFKTENVYLQSESFEKNNTYLIVYVDKSPSVKFYVSKFDEDTGSGFKYGSGPVGIMFNDLRIKATSDGDGDIFVDDASEAKLIIDELEKHVIHKISFVQVNARKIEIEIMLFINSDFEKYLQ